MVKLIFLIGDWFILFVLAFWIFMDNGNVFIFLAVIATIITQIIAIYDESKKEKLIKKKNNNSQN